MIICVVKMQYVKGVIIYLGDIQHTLHYEDTCLPISNNMHAAKKLAVAASNHFSNLNFRKLIRFGCSKETKDFVGLIKLTMVDLNMWVICLAVQQNNAVNGY